MKNYIVAAAMLSLPLWGAATQAADKAPEYTTVIMEFPLNVSADEAWKKYWPFCEVHHQMARAGMAGHECTIDKGNGTDVGSDRRIGNGNTHEILIGKSKYSYTYIQSGSTTRYHHSDFEVVPAGPNKSKFVRRWFWERKGTAEADAAFFVENVKIFTPVFALQAQVGEGANP